MDVFNLNLKITSAWKNYGFALKGTYYAPFYKM